MNNDYKPPKKNKKNVIDSLFQIESFLRNLSTTTSTLKFVKCLKNRKKQN
ncbi:MAG: hypothetical protein J6J36_09245 [Clostridia bacterium]|nr:hypothetical protein [Clostridia bacterium]